MQINAFTTALSPTSPQTARVSGRERVADATAERQPSRQDPTPERLRALRQLDALNRSFDDTGLSRRARAAVSTYLANSPSISERLGVELAGIDERV